MAGVHEDRSSRLNWSSRLKSFAVLVSIVFSSTRSAWAFSFTNAAASGVAGELISKVLLQANDAQIGDATVLGQLTPLRQAVSPMAEAVSLSPICVGARAAVPRASA